MISSEGTTKITTLILALFGWAFLGVSIFSSLTILPLALALAFVESGGPINSGDHGVQVPLIPLLCLAPGILGAGALILRKWFQRMPTRPFIKRCCVLLAIQLAAFVLVLILTPKLGMM